MNKSMTKLNSVTVVGCDLKGNGIDIDSGMKSGRVNVLNREVELSSINDIVVNPPIIPPLLPSMRRKNPMKSNEESNISVMGENGENNIIPVLLNEDKQH